MKQKPSLEASTLTIGFLCVIVRETEAVFVFGEQPPPGPVCKCSLTLSPLKVGCWGILEG